MSEIAVKHLTIQEWDEQDRPREKLMRQGVRALSDAELLAILINTGSGKRTAVDLGKLVMHRANQDLNILGKLDLAALTTIPGIGEAKAVTILAALELGRRRRETTKDTTREISSSRAIYDEMVHLMLDLPIEEVWIILLTRGLKYMDKRRISSGSDSKTLIDVKTICRVMLEVGAGAVVLVHNHPSGNKFPSEEDIAATRRVQNACDLLEIPLLDHVIFAGLNSYYSFADSQLLHS